MKLLFELIGLYLLFRFIFYVVIPIFSTVKTVKKMYEQPFQPQNNNPKPDEGPIKTTKSKNAQPTNHGDEYIDFEEIKV
jgi:hypothetical protein